jgi:hypothetical protein
MKVALVAFRGEIMCFAHVLLNALDMRAKGLEVEVILEGESTALVKTFREQPDAPFRGKYEEVKAAGLITAVCRACAQKMGALEASEAEGLPIVGDMSGHPALATWVDQGYQVITF